MKTVYIPFDFPVVKRRSESLMSTAYNIGGAMSYVIYRNKHMCSLYNYFTLTRKKINIGGVKRHILIPVSENSTRYSIKMIPGLTIDLNGDVIIRTSCLDHERIEKFDTNNNMSVGIRKKEETEIIWTVFKRPERTYLISPFLYN